MNGNFDLIAIILLAVWIMLIIIAKYNNNVNKQTKKNYQIKKNVIKTNESQNQGILRYVLEIILILKNKNLKTNENQLLKRGGSVRC